MQSMSGTLVSIRVLEEIELVVVLCVPPLPAFGDLGNDLFTCERAVGSGSWIRLSCVVDLGEMGVLTFGRKVLRLNLLCNALGDGELVFGVYEYGGTIF